MADAQHILNHPKLRVIPDGCWEYRVSMSVAGYGRISTGTRSDGTRGSEYAHRAIYVLFKGPIPEGHEIDHLCRNRCCVNPEHLEAVLPRVNTLRSPISIAALNARKTHCPQGHPYEGENLAIGARGQRTCRICDRAKVRRHRERVKAVI